MVLYLLAKVCKGRLRTYTFRKGLIDSFEEFCLCPGSLAICAQAHHYSMSKLSWHDRKRCKCGTHLVLNRKQFSHVNPSQLSAQMSTLHVKKGR